MRLLYITVLRRNLTSPSHFRSALDTWHPVCSAGWTGDRSASTCRQLGLGPVLATNVSGIKSEGEEEPPLMLNTTIETSWPLQAATERMGEAEEQCEEVVRLQCQQKGESGEL